MSEPIILTGGGLQVRFQFVGDRFVHTIAAFDDERLTPLAASIEGAPEEEWPASPAIQEVNTQHPGENPLAMLMGQTVQGYWSVTIELNPATGRAEFDVACRVKSAPTLGSSYRTVVTPQPTAEGTRLEVGDVVVEVTSLGTDAAADSGPELVCDDEGFSVICHDSPVKFPQTLRWRYAIIRVK